ncbi:MAG TPA: mechanosensitive ion channel family protein [Vicinamibacterales bacterium]|nr:mechanosensitive ion channel family protein [Vicinamibacterales bacterium]
MPHYPAHLLMGVAALAATLLVWTFTLNRIVRRKLKLSIVLLVAYVLVQVVFAVRPDLAGPDAASDLASPVRAFERLALTAAIINLIVLALINPLRTDRVREGFPAIVQDAIVIGLLLIVATFVFKEQLLTTSAVGAVVVGFALQDTLGNAFAGLAIQSERPFTLGHWIKVGDFEGRVMEVTWRATKLRTKAGNFIIVPNNIVGKEAILNYSEPAVATRVDLEVGVSYQASPPLVKKAMLEAVAQAPLALSTPFPDVLLVGFADWSMNYQVRFWISDSELDEEARDQVRMGIHYAFARRGIEIPYPIQVEYSGGLPGPDRTALQQERERVLASVDLFGTLTGEQRAGLAEATVMRTYGDGEAIVRQGEPGDSMYVVCSGRMCVVVEPERSEVATLDRGEYFGEMSLLTGDPRSATVIARGETVVLELTAEQFRRLAEEHPAAIEQVALAASLRREQLDQLRASAGAARQAEAKASFISRMKRFLHLR